MDEKGYQSWESGPLFQKDVGIPGGIAPLDFNGSPPSGGKKSGVIAILNDDAGNPLSITNLGFRPSFIFFIGSNDQSPGINSNGWTDGVNSASTIMRAGTMDSSFTYPIDVAPTVGNGDGWRAVVAMDNNGFTLTKTKVGAGSSITIKFIAVK